jgi:hypothetical protein
MKNINRRENRSNDGSVLLVSLITMMVLLFLIGTTLVSTSNKYFTAYQWASWQEAMQGAESGADIAMAELRKDVTLSHNAASTPAWANWKIGKYAIVNGLKVRDTTTYKPIASDGTWSDNSGGGGGNITPATLSSILYSGKGWDYLTYSGSLSAHGGEGNNNLRFNIVVDAPASLNISGQQWIRVRASGTTDLSGPPRVSEDRLDNRLRKLGLLIDNVMNRQEKDQDLNNLKKQTTRQIELVAKPVSLFSGSLMTMVQFKDDGAATVSDSFNSEDTTNWPINPLTGEIDLTVSHNPASSLGKNGDIASNAFPTKHDHTMSLDIKGDTIWGDVGNDDSQIKGLDPAYYNTPPDQNNHGLNNGNHGSNNPNANLIKTDGTGDVSGEVSAGFYRDLPPIVNPNWNTGGSAPTANVTYAKVDKGTGDVDLKNYTDPKNPYRIRVGTFDTSGNVVTRGGITIAGSDKWVLKTAPKPSGWNVNTPTIHSYVEIWVTGDIKLDDGGTIVLQQLVDGSGKVISDVSATIYFDRNVKIGETKETKTNNGGFDNQSDDAKNLILLGVTEPDGAQKLPKDSYIDPLGNESLYTPYKATGNILFKENDFTGAIYAPDHNIVFDNSKDYKGKRKKRKQDGNDFYGSYVGRTIHSKKAHNYHFDESLNDAGPVYDWGYVSWFEDVDVDNR